MNFDWLLFPYMIIFTSVAVLWRVYRVWRMSGVNALTSAPSEGISKIVSRYFRVTFGMLVVTSIIPLLPQSIQHQFAPFTSVESPIVAAVGWVILLVILVLVVVAQVQMGEAWRIAVDPSQQSKLVADGIFRFSRNPIFVGMRGLYLGAFLILPNGVTLLLWILGDLLIQLQVQLEEAYLINTFGDEYTAYMRSVRRWV